LRSIGHPGGLHVVAWDPDHVTEANVGRQLFYPGDIGESKSIVLVNRLNLCFGLRWEARATVWKLASGPGPQLLISCVDTARARRVIHQGVSGKGYGGPLYWLDLGNRQHDGQVVLGEPDPGKTFTDTGRADRRLKANPPAPRLPTVMDLFPELLDEKLPEDDRPSCSLAEALETQDLFINQHCATWALELLWRLFRDGRIQHHGAFVNLKDGEVRALPVPSPANGGEK
jgi:PRTRC genetic system ThiF family protein